jgi:predicted ATPase/transcriptional regulator with XRE-family HTH domain
VSAKETFGRWLKQHRKRLDLTQHALAAQSGCTVDTIRKLEATQRRPSPQLVERLAETLQIPAADRTMFHQLARGQGPAGPCICQHSPPEAPADPIPRTNHTLPVPLTPLIGREAERAALCDLVCRPDVRLVTLLGPPGIGNTRLGLQVAADLQEAWATGVQFVPLMPLREAPLFIPTIARVLDVREVGSQPLLDRLVSALQGKQLLMVLDNFEQVVAAAPDIAQVLEQAPDLTLLVTSRAALRITGEHIWPVPPLALPDLGHLPSLDGLLEYSAVQLFVQRALAVHPTFALTEAAAPAVAEICVRLEGVPLALELAAARSRVLSPQALLARLDQRLGLLTGGVANAPERQQSLRAAIAWSYALLNTDAQALFRRLGVFVGGCTLAAIAAVCQDAVIRHGDGEMPLLDSLATLVDQSLLQHTDSIEGEPRFTMLETLRAYALEQLDAAGETMLVRQQHALYYVHLAEHVTPHLWGPDQAAWMQRLEAEHDNLRAVLAWSRTPVGEAALGLRLATALHEFWYWGGYVSEGRGWLEGVVADSAEAAPTLRALVLARASYFAVQQGDYGQAEVLAETSLTLSRQLHYTIGAALALSVLGMVAYFQADNALAQARYRESLRLFRELADQEQIAPLLDRLVSLTQAPGNGAQAAACHAEEFALYRTVGHIRGMCEALTGLGFTMLNLRAYGCARALFAEGLTLARALSAKRSITGALRGLGETALLEGDYTQAAEHYRASLALSQALGIKMDIAVNLGTLGLTALCQGEAVQAAAYFMESMVLNRELGRKRGLVYNLAGCASVACLQGQPSHAARLFGAAAALSERCGHVLELTNRTLYDRDVAAMRFAVEHGLV